jgi:hypothetical protein
LRDGVDTDPRVVDVRGRAHHAVHHDRRHADADGPLPTVVRDELAHHVGEVIRRGVLRRVDAKTVGGELPGRQVDRSRLHPGATDIDAE